MTGGVLICGGTQPLGTRLAEHLVAAGSGAVVLVGIESEPEAVVPDGASYLRVDLTEEIALRAMLHGICRDREISTVVNLAFHRDPHAGRDAHLLNVDAARRLVLLARDHPTIRHLVHRSTAEVYAQRPDRPHVIREDQPLHLDPHAPAWVRERVEADITVSGQMGMSGPLSITVLRCAEILAPGMGSQLYDYLSSRICLRPMGFDPILNLLSLEDAAQAFACAVARPTDGAINIRGADTLPLSRAIRLWGRDDIPVPGPMIGPMYAARRLVRRTRFHYRPNAWRFHFNGLLDGTRAEERIGYRPSHPIDWPGRRAVAES